MPSLTEICMAATFSVPNGNAPKKLMNKPEKKMRINCMTKDK